MNLNEIAEVYLPGAKVDNFDANTFHWNKALRTKLAGLLAFLADPEKHSDIDLWLPKGILVQGASRVGKSRFLLALAAHSNIPVVICRFDLLSVPVDFEDVILTLYVKLDELVASYGAAVLALDDFPLVAPARPEDYITARGDNAVIIEALEECMHVERRSDRGLPWSERSHLITIATSTVTREALSPALYRCFSWEINLPRYDRSAG